MAAAWRRWGSHHPLFELDRRRPVLPLRAGCRLSCQVGRKVFAEVAEDVHPYEADPAEVVRDRSKKPFVNFRLRRLLGSDRKRKRTGQSDVGGLHRPHEICSSPTSSVGIARSLPATQRHRPGTQDSKLGLLVRCIGRRDPSALACTFQASWATLLA